MGSAAKMRRRKILVWVDEPDDVAPQIPDDDPLSTTDLEMEIDIRHHKVMIYRQSIDHFRTIATRMIAEAEKLEQYIMEDESRVRYIDAILDKRRMMKK